MLYMRERIFDEKRRPPTCVSAAVTFSQNVVKSCQPKELIYYSPNYDLKNEMKGHMLLITSLACSNNMFCPCYASTGSRRIFIILYGKSSCDLENGMEETKIKLSLVQKDQVKN